MPANPGDFPIIPIYRSWGELEPMFWASADVSTTFRIEVKKPKDRIYHEVSREIDSTPIKLD